MNIVFMGTPPFAATVLEHVARWVAARGDAHIGGVYCQPDRPAGRGRKVQPSAVKALAQQLGLAVHQPLNFKDVAARDELAALAPDVLVVAAYGLILPQSVLDIPKLGPFNVHGSLLPRYRGAAPIQRAIMNGDTVTGVTIMRMEKGLDTGPMLVQRAMGIGIDDTAGTLYGELADLGGRLMVDVLDSFASGRFVPNMPQDNALATHAAKLSKADGLVDWREKVLIVHARLRGVTPQPGGRTIFRIADKDIAVLLEPGQLGKPFAGDAPAPGTVLGLREGALVIACADAEYLVSTLRPADRKAMSAEAFWNGYLQNASNPTALSAALSAEGCAS